VTTALAVEHQILLAMEIAVSVNESTGMKLAGIAELVMVLLGVHFDFSSD